MCPAIGYAKFNPSTYLELRHHTTQEMHASCYDILQNLVAKVTSKSMLTMLNQPPTGSHGYLYTDPVAVMMITGLSATTTTTIELLVNYDILIPARYTPKLTKPHLDYPRGQHPTALLHLQPGEYLAPAQLAVRDRPVTEEELAAEPKGRPPNRGNTNKRDKGKGRGKPHDHPERDRKHDREYERLWERDNTR